MGNNINFLNMNHFSRKTLNENWYEERLAVGQFYRENRDARMRRDFEPDINCLTSTGLPQPLNRLHRFPKHDTTKLIPSDGYNEIKTIN